MGGLGDRDGRYSRDMADGEREEGKEDSEVRRLLLLGNGLPLEVFEIVFDSGAAVENEVSVVEIVPRVVGRCISASFFLVSFVVR